MPRLVNWKKVERRLRLLSLQGSPKLDHLLESGDTEGYSAALDQLSDQDLQREISYRRAMTEGQQPGGGA